MSFVALKWMDGRMESRQVDGWIDVNRKETRTRGINIKHELFKSQLYQQFTSSYTSYNLQNVKYFLGILMYIFGEQNG
jgi:hypothetical protein